ncbi:MAG: insulinase family protein [Bacteroidales bacterium]|nr:insulinase family protein [Bacteroidales bacterium]
MKRFLVMLLVLVAVATTAFAQGKSDKAAKSDLTAKVPLDKKVRYGHLDNGFTYYIRANKKPENRVQFRLVTNAGSILEDEDQLGLAHFCEHMAFNGTQYFKGNQMISKLQENGIEFGLGINAYTGFDQTVYYVELPSDKADMIEMGFKILDGWAGKLLFAPEEIESERGVILEEWRGGLGADERLRKATWPILLNKSKYAERLPIGTEEVLRTFDRKTITRFYNDWYRPDLQALVIVGDIDVDQMEAKIKSYFSGYAKRENPRKREEFSIPGNVEPLIAIATDKEATSTTLELFWKHKKAHSGTVGDYRQGLVRSLANSMLNGRFSDICEKATAPMTYAGGSYGGFLARDCDAFTLYAAPKENRIEEAATLLLTEMKRLDEHGFLQPELDRAKEALLASYKKMAKEENKTPSDNFADEYTNHFLEGEVAPGIRQEYRYAQEFVPEITLEEINALVATWITDDNFVFYLTAPDKPGYNVPTADDARRIIASVKNIKTEPWVDNFKDEPLFTKELPAVKANVTKTNTALGYKEYTLPNGIKFVVKPTEYKADEIRMTSYAMGGTGMYEDKDYFQASNAAGIIDGAGIAGFSSSQLQKKLKGQIVSISPSISGETQGFNGTCAPKDLETMLQLLYLYYDAPRKDKDAFDRDIEATRNQIKFAGENPQLVLFKELYKIAYQNNPRLIILPTEEMLDGLTLDGCYNVFKERFCDASNQTFFFVGNVADSDIDLIAKYLGALPCNGKQKNDKFIDREPKFAPGINRSTVYKGSDNQGMLICIGKTENFVPTFENRMAINALSDAMSITALEVIREKMGGTYSPAVQVSYDIHPDGTGDVSWLFFINCDPDNASKIEGAVMDILKQYIKKGPNKKTLAKVKEQMLINRQNSMQENGFWMGQIYGSYFYNESRDQWVNDYATFVKNLNIKQVKEMAAKYLNLNNFTLVTLKPEAK